nr:MAG TPA: hypothetical protein [Caudoviricetes sp.]
MLSVLSMASRETWESQRVRISLRQRLRGHLRQRGKHPALAHAQRPGERVV